MFNAKKNKEVAKNKQGGNKTAGTCNIRTNVSDHRSSCLPKQQARFLRHCVGVRDSFLIALRIFQLTGEPVGRFVKFFDYKAEKPSPSNRAMSHGRNISYHPLKGFILE